MPSSSLRIIQVHPGSKAVVMNVAPMEWAWYPRAIVQYLVNHIRMQVRPALLLSASAPFLPPLRTSHFRGNGREGVIMSTLKSGKVRCTALLGPEQRVHHGLRGELLNNQGKWDAVE
jgi:hypothetical protein